MAARTHKDLAAKPVRPHLGSAKDPRMARDAAERQRLEQERLTQEHRHRMQEARRYAEQIQPLEEAAGEAAVRAAEAHAKMEPLRRKASAELAAAAAAQEEALKIAAIASKKSARERRVRSIRELGERSEFETAVDFFYATRPRSSLEASLHEQTKIGGPRGAAVTAAEHERAAAREHARFRSIRQAWTGGCDDRWHSVTNPASGSRDPSRGCPPASSRAPAQHNANNGANAAAAAGASASAAARASQQSASSPLHAPLHPRGRVQLSREPSAQRPHSSGARSRPEPGEAHAMRLSAAFSECMYEESGPPAPGCLPPTQREAELEIYEGSSKLESARAMRRAEVQRADLEAVEARHAMEEGASELHEGLRARFGPMHSRCTAAIGFATNRGSSHTTSTQIRPDRPDRPRGRDYGARNAERATREVALTEGHSQVGRGDTRSGSSYSRGGGYDEQVRGTRAECQYAWSDPSSSHAELARRTRQARARDRDQAWGERNHSHAAHPHVATSQASGDLYYDTSPPRLGHADRCNSYLPHGLQSACWDEPRAPDAPSDSDGGGGGGAADPPMTKPPPLVGASLDSPITEQLLTAEREVIEAMTELAEVRASLHAQHTRQGLAVAGGPRRHDLRAPLGAHRGRQRVTV